MKDLSRLTLEEKTGQLFILGFHGKEPDAETRELLDAIHPGGIVLSQRNFENFAQTVRLTSGFVDGRDLPALVAVHQEGGPADRLRQLFAPLPSADEAARGGTAHLRQLARIVGMELEACGFNTLFGPVLDLGSPDSILRERTFASSPGAVSRLGKAYIEEVASRRILVCPRHFPGMGAAPKDPHFTLPRIEKHKKMLLLEDILPFSNVSGNVFMMMVAHAWYPAFGDLKPLPASLSPRVVDGLLRRRLGFRGVIVTDDLTMGAITGIGLTPERFLQAFEAGNDMLLFSQTTPLVEEAFRTIVAAARRSSVLRDRIDASAERILSLKLRISPGVRNRAQIRTRILRHIDRLTRTVEAAATPA